LVRGQMSACPHFQGKLPSQSLQGKVDRTPCPARPLAHAPVLPAPTEVGGSVGGGEMGGAIEFLPGVPKVTTAFGTDSEFRQVIKVRS